MARKELMMLVWGFEHSDVQNEHIGDGMSVIRLRDEDRKRIYEQNFNTLDRWDVFRGGQTHAFINRYDSDHRTDHEAEQEIIRAFIAVRIIQPASLAAHFVIKVAQDDEGKRRSSPVTESVFTA